MQETTKRGDESEIDAAEIERRAALRVPLERAVAEETEGRKAALCPVLPLEGFVRLPQVLAVIPVSEGEWWRGVSKGRFPPPLKVSPRVTVWRVEDIRVLIKHIGAQPSDPAPKATPAARKAAREAARA